MAGEENPNAAPAPASQSGSVPAVGSQRIRVNAPPHSPLWPYEATTRWRPWPAFWTTVFISALTVAVAIGGSIMATVAAGDSPTSTQSVLALLATLAAQITMTVGALRAARAKGDRLFKSLALKPPAGGFRSYAGALVIVLSTVAIYTAVTQLAIGHDMSGDMGPIAAILRGPWWPLAVFVVVIGAPISEELLFRGFLQPALVPTRLGYWGAAAVTSAAWSALHAGYSIVGLLEVFMIGMIFSYALRRTGSLRVPLACHAIYNALISAIVIIVPKETLGF